MYGDAKVASKSEALPLNPLSPYAVQKAAAEFYVKLFSELYGLPSISLRFFNVFGPRQDPKSEYSAKS